MIIPVGYDFSYCALFNVIKYTFAVLSGHVLSYNVFSLCDYSFNYMKHAFEDERSLFVEWVINVTKI